MFIKTPGLKMTPSALGSGGQRFLFLVAGSGGNSVPAWPCGMGPGVFICVNLYASNMTDGAHSLLSLSVFIRRGMSTEGRKHFKFKYLKAESAFHLANKIQPATPYLSTSRKGSH